MTRLIRVSSHGYAYAYVIGAALLGSCGGSDKPTAKSCPIGDPTAPAELQIVNLEADQATVNLTQASDLVPLVPPPQGGWIVLLGARARNLDGCQLTLTTALVDACTGQILQVDVRPTQLELGDDGWGVSSLTTFGNLPVCPQLTATRDLHDVPYIVKVVVEDTHGQKASAQLSIIPTCGTEPSRCTCECARDYVMGQSCDQPPIDAGVSTCVDAP
ncbi:MAG TPA: hypothetical protein VH165_19615 [Kofleriaceae bacterium]|nr:hypothetical protein [Kofleriaceae bacterium]